MAGSRSFDCEQARRLFAEGASLQAIGERFGVTTGAVCDALEQAGSWGAGAARTRRYDHDLMRRLHREGLTQSEIARRMGCAPSLVCYALGNACWRGPRGPERNRQQEGYVMAERAKGRTLAEIGGDLHLSRQRVQQILRRARAGKEALTGR